MKESVCPECGFDLNKPYEEEPRPKYFYKYCPLYDYDKYMKNLAKSEPEPEQQHIEYAIENLFSKLQYFSSRRTFNDAFDTQINVQLPSAKEKKLLLKALNASKRKEARNILQQPLEKYQELVDKVWDDYRIYCITSSATNNLMWGQYANCHKGFCIEWDSSKIGAEKVEYTDSLPTFNFMNYLNLLYGIETKKLESELSNQFRYKLREWRYENEYRVILSNNNRADPLCKELENATLVPFNSEDWIESIIFGDRTDKRFESYIIDKIPFPVKFKKAKVNLEKGIIEIKPYKTD